MTRMANFVIQPDLIMLTIGATKIPILILALVNSDLTIYSQTTIIMKKGTIVEV